MSRLDRRLGRARRCGGVVVGTGSALILLGTALLTGPAFADHAVPLSPCEPTDHWAPRVVSAAITPGLVDVRQQAARAVLSVVVTDDGDPGEASGVESAVATMSGSWAGGFFVELSSRDGRTWSAPFRVPRGTRAGVWQLMSVVLVDRAGNERRYDGPTDLPQQGALRVRSTEDRDRPVVSDVAFSRTAVDARRGAVRVRLSARARDASGVTSLRAEIVTRDAIRGSNRDVKNLALRRTAGTARNGTWSAWLTVRRWDRSGTWGIESLQVFDRSGRGADATKGNAATLRVRAARDDDEPTAGKPQVNATVLDARGGDARVTVSVRLKDRTSGIAGANLLRPGPFGPEGQAMRLVSGSKHDGLWLATVTVPRCGAVPGQLQLNMYAFDHVDRSVSLGRDAFGITVLAADTRDPEAALDLTKAPARLGIRFAEAVTGLTPATAVVEATPSAGGAPYPVRGRWTCGDAGGASTDCASGHVLAATFEIEAGQPKADGYSVVLNPEGTLGLTDLAGNAPRWYVVPTA
jgi:hypothetical protein